MEYIKIIITVTLPVIVTLLVLGINPITFVFDAIQTGCKSYTRILKEVLDNKIEVIHDKYGNEIVKNGIKYEFSSFSMGDNMYVYFLDGEKEELIYIEQGFLESKWLVKGKERQFVRAQFKEWNKQLKEIKRPDFANRMRFKKGGVRRKVVVNDVTEPKAYIQG